jgi:ferredoxin
MKNVYADLADALNALANGFPRTETGSDLRLLEFMYSEKEAELASCLSGEWETAADISDRLGKLTKETLSGLFALVRQGKVWMHKKDGTTVFRLAPFVVGSYEASNDKMNKEMALLFEEYFNDGGAVGIMKPQPALHRVVPVMETADMEWIMPYDKVLEILEKAETFHVEDCICRKEKAVLGESCEAPMTNCLSFTTVKREKKPGDLTREEALKILKEAEEASLVHSVSNVVNGVHYICNCCGCCCGILRGINDWGIENSVARANYEAIVSSEDCIGCEICIDRCQVHAIEMTDGLAVVNRDKCIGCGLCVTTCAPEAMKLALRPNSERMDPPESFGEWETMRLADRKLT